MNTPNTCSGYQSALVRFLVCKRSSMAKLCSFCFSPKSRTTSQLSPLTAEKENKVSVYYKPYSVNSDLPLIHRQVAQSSRGFARNSSSVSLVNSYFSILSFEKSTAVICDCTLARHRGHASSLWMLTPGSLPAVGSRGASMLIHLLLLPSSRATLLFP